MENLLSLFAGAESTYYYVYIAFLRYLMPVLALLLLIRCLGPLLTFRREPEIWAWLCMADEKNCQLPIGKTSSAEASAAILLLIFLRCPAITRF